VTYSYAEMSNDTAEAHLSQLTIPSPDPVLDQGETSENDGNAPPSPESAVHKRLEGLSMEKSGDASSSGAGKRKVKKQPTSLLAAQLKSTNTPTLGEESPQVTHPPAIQKHTTFALEPVKSHSEPLMHLRSHSMVALPAVPGSLRRSTSRLFRASNSLATLPNIPPESHLSPAASFLASVASPFSVNIANVDTIFPKEGDRIERYTLGKLLGRGSFSMVLEAWASRQDLMHVGYIAPDEDGDPVCVAVKIVRKEHGGGLKTESAPATQTTHPNLLHHSTSSPILLMSESKPISSRPTAAEFLSSFTNSHVSPLVSPVVSPQTAPGGLTATPGMPEAPPEVFNMLDHEISIWQALQHPNIVQLIEVIDTEETTFVVCESCRGGNLLEALKTHKSGLSEHLAWHWFKQVTDGILYLHTIKGIAHRDLKLENILLTWSPDLARAIVKIGDFGLSEFVGSCLDKTGKDESIAGGSLPYCAPELLRKDRKEQCEAQSATTSSSPNVVAQTQPDCWAMGVILYALLTGTLPFHDDFAPRLQLKITRGLWDESKLEKLSPSSREVVKGLLTTDPSQRWNIERLASCSWITNGPLH
jgi:serine/threonine protein kinase